jgi:hypothetical protein
MIGKDIILDLGKDSLLSDVLIETLNSKRISCYFKQAPHRSKEL